MYLNEIVRNVMKVVKRGPLNSVIATNIRNRYGGTVLFDEGSEFVEVAVSRGGEDVDDKRLVVGFGDR